MIRFNQSIKEKFGVEVLSGLASPYETPGDSLYFKQSKNLQVFTVLDGVSQSKSPSESSIFLKDLLSDYFLRCRSLNLNSYLGFLRSVSLKMLSQNYSSTLVQVIVLNHVVYTLNIGDSQSVLYLTNNSRVISWPHNVGFSNCEKNKSSHILSNWMGADNFRIELSVFHRDEVKAGFLFSDGLLDLFEVKSLAFDDLFNLLKKKFRDRAETHLEDDASFICFQF